MSFWRRMLSGDFRRAVAAEAAGDLDRAAESYGLAGDREGAVRMHLLRAGRAGSRTLEVAALRDAMHWAGEDAGLQQRVAARLGEALLSNLEAEGIATQRDRDRLREAAELLLIGGQHVRAGEALAKIGDHLAAANAFSAGGHVELMEAAIAKDDDGQRQARQEQDAFSSYQTHMAIGRRDEARAELQRCVASATSSSEYRRLLDTLEAKLITGGRVELLVRGRTPVVVCSVKRLVLGRDALCDLALRSGGVSRQHAEIEQLAAPAAFVLRDLGSRNGTRVGGLPLAGPLPLAGAGSFSLGEECAVDFDFVAAAPNLPAFSLGGGLRALPGAAPPPSLAPDGAEAAAAPPEMPVLRLRVPTGLDRGALLLAVAEPLAIDLGVVELGAAISFRGGRPFLCATTAKEVRFEGEPLGSAVAVQLIRGDHLRLDGVDLDVA